MRSLDGGIVMALPGVGYRMRWFNRKVELLDLYICTYFGNCFLALADLVHLLPPVAYNNMLFKRCSLCQYL